MKKKVSKEEVKAYFGASVVVDHYVEATIRLGLWASEAKIFESVFSKDAHLLDLGCGAGRISFGLKQLGYQSLEGSDLSTGMIAAAQALSEATESGIVFQVADATRLPYGNDSFDGIIFGFNGLMQIPGIENRLKAFKEIRRIIKPGGKFVFTTHDREHYQFGDFWAEEAKRWNGGKQGEDLVEFGDRYEPTALGDLFMHVPSREEIKTVLQDSGWTLLRVVERSALAIESEQVRAFSDDCLFWVVESTP